MTNETQNAIQETGRDIQNAPSRLETLAYSTLGATSGILLTGAFLYDPLSAAVGAGAIAAVGAGAGVAAGAVGVAGAAGAMAAGVGVGVAVAAAAAGVGAIAAGAIAAAGAGVAAAGAVGVTYFLNRTHDVKKRLGKVFAGGALIASLATGAGYALGNYRNRITSVTPLTLGEEQGIVVKTPRDSQIYLLRDGTNYVSLNKAREDALRSVTSSYAEKEQGIQAHYDKISRALSATNAATKNTVGTQKQ